MEGLVLQKSTSEKMFYVNFPSANTPDEYLICYMTRQLRWELLRYKHNLDHDAHMRVANDNKALLNIHKMAVDKKDMPEKFL